MQAKVNEDWDAIFRIASGSSDSPTSTNQTLGDSGSNAFSSKALWIDLAYAHWHPGSKPGFDMYFGKMSNPFYTVGGNQLIWDGDVTPEGIAASYSFDLSEKDKVTFTGGGFWLAERNNDADSGYFGLQGLIDHKFDNGSNLLAGASFYDIGNLNPAPSGVSALGNTLVGSAYRYDYDMLEGFGEYGFKMNGMPVTIHGNYVKNLAAASGSDTAYMVGFKLNKAKKPGSWKIGYNYRDVESDAVFAGLSDSDFMLGGTDGRGHSIGLKYQVDKNLQAGFTYLAADRFRNKSTLGTQKVNVFQADLVWKF